MASIAPDTTVAFFAREDSRRKAPSGLHEAVLKAGGTISTEQSVKSWKTAQMGDPDELVSWVCSSTPTPRERLISSVGDRQQRLLRELEKLALWAGPGAQLGPAEIEEIARAIRRASGLDAGRCAGRCGDTQAATRVCT